MSGYLLAEDVAQLVGCSVRSVHEHARLGKIPHRRIGGTRRLLFIEEEITAWVDGAELERIETPQGGRVVRPKGRA
jgi:predicted DNA-binding transcriptional regulator AlpA